MPSLVDPLCDESLISDEAKAWLHLEPKHGGLGLLLLSDFAECVTEARDWDKAIRKVTLDEEDYHRQAARTRKA